MQNVLGHSHAWAQNHDLGSELLRLREDTAGEGLTGNALRESEVVLDASAPPDPPKVRAGEPVLGVRVRTRLISGTLRP
jgi:hypothetical protein